MSKKIEQDAEAKAKADAEAKAKADEEAARADQGDEGDESDEDEDADDQDDSGSSKTIDYKKLAEEEEEKRKAAEALIAANKFKKKHKKDDDDEDEDDEEDEDDKPLTRREARELLASTNQAAIKTAQADRIVEIANELADTPEEANFIIQIHRNRQFPSYLSLRDQLEEAHAIANRKKLASEKAEVVRALKSKDNVSRDTTSGHRDGQQGTAPKLSAQDDASYKRAGFEYSKTERVWKKKLPNGKFLIKDPKSKATYIK